MQTRSRNWCFTIQADEEGETTWPVCTEIPIEVPTQSKFIMCQVERAPTTGKIHLQGFCCFKNAIGMATAVRLLGGHAHVEPMRGTVQENEVYCGKEDSRINGPWREGDPPINQGKRTDWHTVRDIVKEGVTDDIIYERFPHLANCSRGVDTLRKFLGPKPEYVRDVRVICLWGPPGSGKSHRARTTYPDAFCVTGAYHEGKTFDQYNDESVLILDEFRDIEWPNTFVNALLDKWKLTLTCRYNNKYASWNTVIIISNEDPVMFWGGSASFYRRIQDRIIEVKDWHNPDVDLTTF